MRSGIGMMAMVGAASAALLMGAPPAVAQTDVSDGGGIDPSPSESVEPEFDANGVLKCTREFGGDSTYAVCGRNPVDGDPGGVSGFGSIRSTDLANFARIDFQAKGDKLTLNSDMPSPAHFDVWTRDGDAEWEYTYGHVEEDGVVDGKEVGLDLPEDARVWMAVSNTDATVAAVEGSLIA